MAESGGLLNRCTGKTVPGVRIPLSPPTSIRSNSINGYIAAKGPWTIRHTRREVINHDFRVTHASRTFAMHACGISAGN